VPKKAKDSEQWGSLERTAARSRCRIPGAQTTPSDALEPGRLRAQQLALAELLSREKKTTSAKVRTVAAHTACVRTTLGRPRASRSSDETRVPVETITVPNPHAQGLAPDQYEVIAEKVTYRLAQRPGSFMMLKYVREMIKLNEGQAIRSTKRSWPRSVTAA
jgi:hypothetical protein